MIARCAFSVNERSPTPSASSTTIISGSTWIAVENASRTSMPDEYFFTGTSRNASTPENATIASRRCARSLRVIPRSEPFRYTLSRPVSSGWKPAVSSMSGTTRFGIETVPRVGVVTPQSTLRSVLLPAPFLPTTPRQSPESTSSDTSSSAQSSFSGVRPKRRLIMLAKPKR